MPSLSVEPDASKVTLKGAVPVTGVALILAVGALLLLVAAVTTIGVVVEPVRPLLSVTVRVAVYVPAEVKV